MSVGGSHSTRLAACVEAAVCPVDWAVKRVCGCSAMPKRVCLVSEADDTRLAAFLGAGVCAVCRFYKWQRVPMTTTSIAILIPVIRQAYSSCKFIDPSFYCLPWSHGLPRTCQYRMYSIGIIWAFRGLLILSRREVHPRATKPVVLQDEADTVVTARPSAPPSILSWTDTTTILVYPIKSAVMMTPFTTSTNDQTSHQRARMQYQTRNPYLIRRRHIQPMSHQVRCPYGTTW